MFLETARETQTFRNRDGQTALPIRRWTSYLPGVGVGGAGVHWNGQTFRFMPADIKARSHNEDRYGPLSADMTVQDYPLSYDELEPHYDWFEKICGISGKAGNLNGEIQPGGNPFEGWRSSEYPNPPMKATITQDRFIRAATELGMHPFPGPSANMSRAYVNPLGLRLAPCSYCGFCEKFACGNNSKASPQVCILPVLMAAPNFELRTNCQVMHVDRHPDGTRASAVTHVVAQAREWHPGSFRQRRPSHVLCRRAGARVAPAGRGRGSASVSVSPSSSPSPSPSPLTRTVPAAHSPLRPLAPCVGLPTA